MHCINAQAIDATANAPHEHGIYDDEEEVEQEAEKVEEKEEPSLDPVNRLLSHKGVDFYDSADAATAGKAAADPFEPLKVKKDYLPAEDAIPSIIRSEPQRLVPS